MFVHTTERLSIAIPQASHAWLAWQVASHWGNRRFARPAPAADVLAAILLHDAGWDAYDAAPAVDRDGRPVTFDRMPVADHIPIWKRSLAAVEAYTPYAALIVAAHIVRLAEHKERDCAERGDDGGAAAIRRFVEATAVRVAHIRARLAGDPRYAPFLDGPGWERNVALLAVCDRIAVHLCTGSEAPFASELMICADGAPLRFEPVDGGVWRVSPWPLVGARLDLDAVGVELPASGCADDAEAAELLASGAIRRLRFRLVSRS